MRLRLWLTRPPPALILLFFLLCLASALIPLFLLLRHPSTETPRETPAETVVKEAIEQHKIVIFSKSYCPYCKRAKAIFSELNEKPFVIELDQREDGYDIQKAVINLVARRTVPQVFIHKQHLGGADDTLEAYQSGKLAKLLGIKKFAQRTTDTNYV